KLNELISVRVDDQTSIVRVSVDGEYPALAAAVANRVVEYLNDFNTKKRQSQARERRKFTEARVVAADSELRSREEAVKTVYDRGPVGLRGRVRRSGTSRSTRRLPRAPELAAAGAAGRAPDVHSDASLDWCNRRRA